MKNTTSKGNAKTEHTLVCLSASPTNAKIVKTAAKMASAFGGSFTALYVQTPDSATRLMRSGMLGRFQFAVSA